MSLHLPVGQAEQIEPAGWVPALVGGGERRGLELPQIALSRPATASSSASIRRSIPELVGLGAGPEQMSHACAASSPQFLEVAGQSVQRAEGLGGQRATASRAPTGPTQHGLGLHQCSFRYRLAAQTGEQQLDCPLSQLLDRLAHRGQRRTREACAVVIVESNHGHVIRDRQSARRELGQHANRRVVVGADDRVHLVSAHAPLVEQLAHCLDTRGFDEVARQQQLFPQRNPVRLELLTKSELALVAVGVARGTPNECRPTDPVVTDQVLEHGIEATAVVGQQVRKAGKLADRHHWNATAPGEVPNPLGTDLAGQDAGHYHDAIDGRSRGQVVDERAVESIAGSAPVREVAARETAEIRPQTGRGSPGTGDQARLVRSLQSIDQPCDPWRGRGRGDGTGMGILEHTGFRAGH